MCFSAQAMNTEFVSLLPLCIYILRQWSCLVTVSPLPQQLASPPCPGNMKETVN